MRAQIKVILPRVGNIMLDQCAWYRVTVLVAGQARGREEANMVTLLSNYNSHLWLSYKLAAAVN